MKRQRRRVRSKPRLSVVSADILPAEPLESAASSELQKALIWQLLPAAMAWATGVMLLALNLPSLASFQLGDRSTTLVVLLVGASLGTLAGEWLPRWILRRRESEHDTTTPPVSFDFSAGIVGGLLLSLAVIALIAVVSLQGVERYRNWLVDGWGWPAEFRYWLILLPIIGLFICLALAVVASMTALHGWYRLVAGAEVGFRLLWFWIGGGLLAGLLVQLIVDPMPAKIIVSLALICIAAGITVSRRRDLMLVTLRTDALERLSVWTTRAAVIIGGLSAFVWSFPNEKQHQPVEPPPLISGWLAPGASLWETADPDIWKQDLTNDQPSALVIIDNHQPPLWHDRVAVARLAERAIRRLLPGGRAIIVMPSPEATAAAEAWCQQANPRLRKRIWRIDHERGDQVNTYMVFDPGFDAWRMRMPAPDDLAVRISRPGRQP